MLGKAWSQRKYSLRCLQKTTRKVGNALKVAQLMQNSLSSRVSQGLSEYNPFLQIQKYQSETVGTLTEQCRMKCQESVDNTWLSTSFTLCTGSSLPTRSQKSISTKVKSIWLSLSINWHCKQREGGNLIKSSSSVIPKDVHVHTTSACSFRHSFGHPGSCLRWSTDSKPPNELIVSPL